MVDPIDWSHPPPSWTVAPELHVLHGVNVAYKLQDLLHQPGLEHAFMGMRDQRTACAATQGNSSGTSPHGKVIDEMALVIRNFS